MAEPTVALMQQKHVVAACSFIRWDAGKAAMQGMEPCRKGSYAGKGWA